MKEATISYENIKICVDYRTELLGIIQVISDYRKKYPDLIQKKNNKIYIEAIEKQFSQYKNHETIELYNYLIENHNFCYNAPIALFLQLENDFSFKKLAKSPFEDRLNSDPKAIRFLKKLPEFAKTINFDYFYKNNFDLYQKFINDIYQLIKNNNFINYMKDYYGMPLEKQFVVNLIPFQTRGNYGYNNNSQIFASICCHDYEPHPLEEMYKIDEFELLHLLFHEFSHSIINPLTAKHYHSKENIFKNIMPQMDELAYGNNSTIINEHFIRALTIRFQLHRTKNKDDYQYIIKKEKNHGFIHIERILNSLIYYEQNRNQYKNIEDFYPVLLNEIILAYAPSKKIK